MRPASVQHSRARTSTRGFLPGSSGRPRRSAPHPRGPTLNDHRLPFIDHLVESFGEVRAGVAIRFVRGRPRLIYDSRIEPQHREFSGGEGGIRTHGSFHYIRFPGVPDRPLQHLSAARTAAIVPSHSSSGLRSNRAFDGSGSWRQIAPSRPRAPRAHHDDPPRAYARPYRESRTQPPAPTRSPNFRVRRRPAPRAVCRSLSSLLSLANEGGEVGDRSQAGAYTLDDRVGANNR